MIDREALRREANSEDGDRTVVSRAWLKQVHQELSLLDKLRAPNGREFQQGAHS